MIDGIADILADFTSGASSEVRRNFSSIIDNKL